MAFVDLDILPQPDETTCGPTCLHAVYRYYGDQQPLARLIGEVRRAPGGGTLAAWLAIHALRRGYRAVLHPYDLEVFDPTWFEPGAEPLGDLLRRRLDRVDTERVRRVIPVYLDFLEAGGVIAWEDMGSALIRRYLGRGRPLLTGLSATYLYREARENPRTGEADPDGGHPAGHFVVLCGWDAATREVEVLDPLQENPLAPGHRYRVCIERVVGAIMLGNVTFDANLLVLEPVEGRNDEHAPRRQ